VKPLFLLSLPRAGSTLVQRVLAAHPEVATVSEPWLLLPYVYATRSRGTRADYWQEAASGALADFGSQLEGGEAQYRRALGEFVLGLYGAAGGEEARYFLDKTPHYHAIAEELPDLFEQPRFLVLWRNPLAILSSLLATFRRSRFEPYQFRFDLFDGIDNLCRFATSSAGNVTTTRYEDLVGHEGEIHWRRLFEDLELEFDPSVLRRFDEVQLRGRYGDRGSGHCIASRSLEKWPGSLHGRVRKAWCVHWLRWIGPARMEMMGYDFDVLMRQVAGLPDRGLGALDLADLAFSWTAAELRRMALSVPDSPRPRGRSRSLGWVWP
jgi:hypothetical protein